MTTAYQAPQTEGGAVGQSGQAGGMLRASVGGLEEGVGVGASDHPIPQAPVAGAPPK